MFPLRVKAPAPLLVSAKAPGPLCSVPLKTLDALSLPTLSIAPAPVFVTVPVPVKEPTEFEKPFRFKVTLTVKSEKELKAVTEPACSVPALTVVTPL